LTNYYKYLLTKPIKDLRPVIFKITRHIPSLVTQEKHEALTRTITQEEVDQAVKEIPPGKSPGLDGFTPNFFHYCCLLIWKEVWKVVEESRTSGQVLSTFNATFLTHSPKEEMVMHPKQFQPISLCNVIYKIITKFISLRLKLILPYIISKEEVGYVEGRKIMDNVILAHEVIYSLK